MWLVLHFISHLVSLARQWSSTGVADADVEMLNMARTARMMNFLEFELDIGFSFRQWFELTESVGTSLVVLLSAAAFIAMQASSLLFGKVFN